MLLSGLGFYQKLEKLKFGFLGVQTWFQVRLGLHPFVTGDSNIKSQNLLLYDRLSAEYHDWWKGHVPTLDYSSNIRIETIFEHLPCLHTPITWYKYHAFLSPDTSTLSNLFLSKPPSTHRIRHSLPPLTLTSKYFCYLASLSTITPARAGGMLVPNVLTRE